MINWDELKHIHVIRNLEQILAQWFKTEVFILDSQGRVQNYDPSDRQRQFKNPICASLLPYEKGRELLLSKFNSVVEKLYEGSGDTLIFDGPLGIEKGLICPIKIDGDILGAVCAFSFIEKNIPDSDFQNGRKIIENLGLDVEFYEEAAAKLNVLEGKDKKYFIELVGLVAQEIVAFHQEISKREDRIKALNSELGNRYKYNSMIGKSKPMQDLYSMLDKIKTSESSVLIQGENGTGKELIAKAVHFNSPRQEKQFVTVNCSAFNENLLDSELFGHVRGAFTGAVKDKKGLFEAADGGTLFLDEIGDMTLSMQVKLLRVLQEGTLTPVGGIEEKKVHVRIIAATNQDLKEMIEQSTFREDLYYRVNVIHIQVPKLRNRKEDIPLLIDHFLVKGCKEKEVPLKNIGKRTMEKIYDYPWPGNIRELENEIERLIVLSGADVRVTVDMLSQRIRDFGANAKVQGVRVSGKLRDALEELEKTMIREGLRRTNWNKSRLAKELGISRAGLIMKVEKYGLDKRRIAKAAAAAAAAKKQA